MTEDARPLTGKKIVVTRARAQAGKFAQMLEDLGATVIEFPTIEIRRVEPAPEIPPFTEFDWVVFTSANAVTALLDTVDGSNPAGDLRNCRVCAIGPGTSTALRDRGAKVDLVPGDHIQEGVLDALWDADPLISLRRVLIPRGDLARDHLGTILRKLGATVTEIVVYQTVAPTMPAEAVQTLLGSDPDILTFTSASTARNFTHIVGREGLLRLRKSLVASIGPETSAAAREAGLRVDVESGKHDLWSLAQALTTIETPPR